MDLRIKKTYRALTEAFTRLLSERRYEEISVAALCDEAMIRRTTFYKHFRDKDDFFAFFINSLREGVMDEAEPTLPVRRRPETPVEPDQLGRRQIFERLASFLLAHEALMDNIFNSSMVGTMELVICDIVAVALRRRYGTAEIAAGGGTKPAAGIPASELDRAAEFAAGGIVRLMLLWWQTGELQGGIAAFVDASDELVGRVMEGVR